MVSETARDWAVAEFGTARMKDDRWRRRLVSMGAQVARRPGGTVSEVFNDAAARQGAYGLLESGGVSRQEIAEAMFAGGARRCAEFPFVFAPVDGSSVSLTDVRRTKGFGSVGNHAHGARGLKVMSALLVSPSGVPLGLGSQVWWTRTGAPKKKNHKKRPTEEKETQRWLEAAEQTRETMGANAPETRLWFQLDREGDAWPIILNLGKAPEWFTVRGNHNRNVTLADGSRIRLQTLLGRQRIACTYPLSVSAGPGRSERTATMTVRGCEATLAFRNELTGERFSKTLNVVLAQEEGTTPAGEKPIRWLLLTNRQISTVEELKQVLLGYAQRWKIELFHRTWKSGACEVEQMQLRSVEAAEKWATVLAAVAIKIERIKQLSRTEPLRPATDEFTPVELRAIALVRFGEKAPQHCPKGTVPTIEQAVRWLAEIGGYTGKSSGGPPGSMTISRGLREVLTVARVLALTAKGSGL